MLHRDFTADDLAPSLRASGVDATVLVQTADTLAETDALLATAERTPFVAGVVGWVPLADPSGTERALEQRHPAPRLRAVRHLINTEPDPDWLVRDEVLEGLTVLARHGLAFDAVPTSERQLDHVVTVARAVPELRIVLDHLGRPPLLRRGWEPWASTIRRLADRPNVAAKVSIGLDVVVDWARWDRGELQPYLDHAISCFGPDRLMAASNWPVVLLAGSYEQVWSATREALTDLSPAERNAVLGGTARRWYRLPPPSAVRPAT
jgi:L-fuconolactonase